MALYSAGFRTSPTWTGSIAEIVSRLRGIDQAHVAALRKRNRAQSRERLSLGNACDGGFAGMRPMVDIDRQDLVRIGNRRLQCNREQREGGAAAASMAPAVYALLTF
jgi:hypothetical protein